MQSMAETFDKNLVIPVGKNGLLPESLIGYTAKSDEIIREYTSENAKRAFSGDIKYIQAWLHAMGYSLAQEITEALLEGFIIQHLYDMPSEIDRMLVEGGVKAKLGLHSLGTIKRRLCSLSVVLNLKKLPNPVRNKKINMLLRRFATMQKSKPRKSPITKDVLKDLLDTCDNSIHGLRDKAILYFGFSSGGRRRSEIVGARMENLQQLADGSYLYNLTKSKTNQTDEDDLKPLLGKAAKALKDWLEVSKITEGFIFRSVGKSGDIRGPLSGIDITRVIKRRAKMSGYDDTKFSAHGLRHGFVSEAGRQGKSLLEVMKMTSHKSVVTASKYYDGGNILNNSCSNLAD